MGQRIFFPWTLSVIKIKLSIDVNATNLPIQICEANDLIETYRAFMHPKDTLLSIYIFF